MRVVCISDTHLAGPEIEIPDGDILIHSGDHTFQGTLLQLTKAGAWFSSLPHKWKITIPGNHDRMFEKEEFLARVSFGEGLDGVRILIDQEIEVEGLQIWGSPWTPRYGNGWAFQLDPGTEHWKKIPEGLDILITHGPPFGVLDRVRGQHVGDKALLTELGRAEPRYHVFGHIHDGHGEFSAGGVHFVNAAVLDDAYAVTYKPVVLDISPKGDMMKVNRGGGSE